MRSRSGPLLTLRMGRNARCFRFTPDGSRILYAQDATVRQLDTRTTHRLEALLYIFNIAERFAGVSPKFEAIKRYIREQSDIEPPVRQMALLQVQALGDFDEVWGEGALKKLLSPLAGRAVYEDVLANARRRGGRAVQRRRDECIGGCAVPRGRFQEAVATLEQCQDLRKCDARINTAFLTMANPVWGGSAKPKLC